MQRLTKQGKNCTSEYTTEHLDTKETLWKAEESRQWKTRPHVKATRLQVKKKEEERTNGPQTSSQQKSKPKNDSEFKTNKQVKTAF